MHECTSAASHSFHAEIAASKRTIITVPSPFLMCLAGSRCLEKLCDSVEVTGEIFTDFHLQPGRFMWLQRLCKDLDSSCCYIRSNRTTMSVGYVRTLPRSANSEWCRAVFSRNAIKNNGFHVSFEVLRLRMMRRLGAIWFKSTWTQGIGGKWVDFWKSLAWTVSGLNKWEIIPRTSISIWLVFDQQATACISKKKQPMPFCFVFSLPQRCHKQPAVSTSLLCIWQSLPLTLCERWNAPNLKCVTLKLERTQWCRRFLSCAE